MVELQQFIDKLTREDEADRIFVAEDIGYANQPEGGLPLLSRLPDELSRESREAIFSALLQIPYLDRAFSKGDNDCRKVVLDVFAKFEGTDAPVIYQKALIEGEINVLITAMEALGVMHLTEAPSLKLLAAKEDHNAIDEVARFIDQSDFQSPVLTALTALHGRFRDAKLPPSLASALKRMVPGDASPIVAYKSVRMLGGLLGRDDVAEFMGQCATSTDKAIRIAALEELKYASRKRTDALLAERLAHETDAEVLQAVKR